MEIIPKPQLIKEPYQAPPHSNEGTTGKSKKKRRGSNDLAERKKRKTGGDEKGDGDEKKKVRISDDEPTSVVAAKESEVIRETDGNAEKKKKKKKKKGKKGKTGGSGDSGEGGAGDEENRAPESASVEPPTEELKPLTISTPAKDDSPTTRTRSSTHSALKSSLSPSPTSAHRRHKSVSFSPDTKREDGDSIRQLKAGLLPLPGQSHPKKQHPPNENKAAKKRARKAKSHAKKEAELEGYEIHPGLVYIKTYLENREGWKFRKQKQNWVLRNWMDVAAVPDGAEGYDKALAEYIKGLQSEGARDRVLKEAREVAEKKGGEGELAERKLKRAKRIIRALGHDVEDGSDIEVSDAKESSAEPEDSEKSNASSTKKTAKDDESSSSGDDSSSSSNNSGSEAESSDSD